MKVSRRELVEVLKIDRQTIGSDKQVIANKLTMRTKTKLNALVASLRKAIEKIDPDVIDSVLTAYFDAAKQSVLNPEEDSAAR